MKSKLGLKGSLRLEVSHVDGTTENRSIPNTIVNDGFALVSTRLISGAYAAPDPVGWMAIGIGSSTITTVNTTLGSEYLRYGLGSITGSTTTTVALNDTARWIGSFGIDATKVVNEAGLFNASGLDLGSMLSRTAFADISVVSGDTIKGTWDIASS